MIIVFFYHNIFVAQFLQGRIRIRQLAQEKKNQIMGELEMAVAIRHKDFLKCVSLAESRCGTFSLILSTQAYIIFRLAGE